MKTATLPAVRVEPALRETLEMSLHEGETLSEFVEAAVRREAQRRSADAEFTRRGLQSLQRAREGEATYSVDEVLKGLQRRAVANRKR
jgi:hypothetical protein